VHYLISPCRHDGFKLGINIVPPYIAVNYNGYVLDVASGSITYIFGDIYDLFLTYIILEYISTSAPNIFIIEIVNLIKVIETIFPSKIILEFILANGNANNIPVIYWLLSDPSI